MERREHHADTRHHDVEFVVAERQCVGVGLAPFKFDAALGGKPAALPPTTPGHRSLATTLAPVSCGGDRGVSGACGHVEHAVAGTDAGWLRPARAQAAQRVRRRVSGSRPRPTWRGVWPPPLEVDGRGWVGHGRSPPVAVSVCETSSAADRRGSSCRSVPALVLYLYGMPTQRSEVRQMSGYGQFCPVAKAMELLDERWTMLVVRELLLGSAHFNDLRRGVPKMSPALLSKRLKTLTRAGVVERTEIDGRTTYSLTPRAARNSPTWSRRSAPGACAGSANSASEDLDPHLLMWDIRRTIPIEAWPRVAHHVGVPTRRGGAEGVAVVAGGGRRRGRRVRLRSRLRGDRHSRNQPAHAHPHLARRHRLVTRPARRQRRGVGPRRCPPGHPVVDRSGMRWRRFLARRDGCGGGRASAHQRFRRDFAARTAGLHAEITTTWAAKRLARVRRMHWPLNWGSTIATASFAIIWLPQTLREQRRP